ncbi:MAG: amino acid adenylation domain-containing protein [Alphaproteobacteria bacterium]
MTRPASVEPGRIALLRDEAAIVEPGRGRVSYASLDELASRVAASLVRAGVGRGDRVGMQLRRSTDAVAAILGILRAGAAYVPVDPAAPAERNARILADARVRITLLETRLAAPYRAVREGIAAATACEEIVELDDVGLGRAISTWADESPGTADLPPSDPRDAACLLYTSGSTGEPKGWVMLRQAIRAHAGWVHDFLRPGPGDVYANHAQLNFGMSLFDLFSSLTSGATLVLVPDEIRLLAPRVAELWSRERVTIWFSAPAILGLVADAPGLDDLDLSSLRAIGFAGERFPAPRLAKLRARLPGPRYLSIYGSTEANVAAVHELPPERHFDEPAPIGRVCPHYESRVVGEDGREVGEGGTGELRLRGAGIDSGYFERPDLDAAAYAVADDGGEPWFRTGDLVTVLPGGDLRFAGRIGRMVKVRGYRVEPGEIEVRLQSHPDVREAAVVPREGPDGVRLVAHLGGPRLPVVELKLFISRTLPAYMVPERFVFHERLPRNLRGKIDLAALRAVDPDTGR